MADQKQTRKKIEHAVGQRAMLQSRLEEKIAEEEALKRLRTARELMQVLVQKTAQETQEQLKMHLKDITQSALDVCFPGKYTFVLNFEMRRGKTECDILLESDGDTFSPLDSTGGGLVDTIAMGLRMACMILSGNERILIMDEPFKFLSVNLKPVMAELLKELSHRLGIQVICVTHDDEFAAIADKSFSIKQKRRRSYIEG